MSPSELRILFISEGYPPASGGVATSAQRVSRNLSRLGANVMALTFDTSRPVESDDYALEERDEDVRVVRVGPFFPKQTSVETEWLSEKVRATFRRRAFDQMERLAREFEPTVVLSFYVGNAGFLATYVARSLGVPHVVGVRGNDIGGNIFYVGRLGLVRLVIEAGARIICVNEHLRRRLLVAFPEAASKTAVISNGVELPADLRIPGSREYLSESTSWPIAEPVAVFIGEPREKKGVTLLLRAVQMARASVPLRLLVVGPELAANERRQCGALWDSLLADGALHVTGHLPRTTALRIASEGNFVLMPSIDDGMANGLLEGMALGLCPVVSDVFADVVPHGEAGWVVRRNDPAQFSDALVCAVNALSESERLGRLARARVEAAHAPRGEAESYLRVFAETVGNGAAP